MGKYVVIEGIDTTGKSTQIALLRKRYKNAIFTKEPSGGDFGDTIRTLSLHSDICNLTQTMLFLADRAHHTKRVILPNLGAKQLVISDRSLISGVAYCDSLDFDLALQINRAVAKVPNLAVILETNEAILRSRLSQKENDNIESRGIAYLLAVQERIIKTAESFGVNTLKISCDLPKDEILEMICAEIDSLDSHKLR
ncbi:dTMP kinase [Helicobacter sp. 23-1045]